MGNGLQFVGDITPLTKDVEVNLGPEGTTAKFRVSSPNLNDLLALVQYYAAFGSQTRFIGPDGGETREVEIQLPGPVATDYLTLEELPFDKWELISNEGSDSIFACPNIVYSTLNYNDKVVLSRLALDGGTVAQAVANCNADLSAGTLQPAPYPGDGGTGTNQFQAPTAAASSQLAKEIQKGQTDFYKPTYVLRHTSFCSTGNTYNNSASGQGYIYPVANLLSEVSSGWTFNLPGRLYAKIASLPPQYAPSDEAPYYQWGWLKKIARETITANFMVAVDIEYELGLWSNLRYPVL